MKPAAVRPGTVGPLLPWRLWLALLYAVWLGLVVQPGSLAQVRAHWPIAATILFGSYVAGSTPLGGTAVRHLVPCAR